MPIVVQELKVCDVCRLLDGDLTLKATGYCAMCDAHICAEDANKWGRRLRAALKRKLEPDYRGVEDYIAKAVPGKSLEDYPQEN